MTVKTVLLAAALALTACGEASPAATPADERHCGLDLSESRLKADGQDRFYADGSAYEGMGLDEAKQRAADAGLILRVIGEDGTCFDHSLGANPKRVTAYVEDGKIVRAVGV